METIAFWQLSQTAQRLDSDTSKRAVAHALTGMREIVVFCPVCKALEVLSFNDGWLMETRKFTQIGDGVYHDCGSSEPCRLYRTVEGTGNQ